MSGGGKDEAAAARVSMSIEVLGEDCGAPSIYSLPPHTHPFLTPSLPCSSKGLLLALVC